MMENCFIQHSAAVTSDRIRLDPGECWYTHDPFEMLTLEQGRISVFVVPWMQTSRHDRSACVAVVEGGEIPPCIWRDASGELWCFALVAGEQGAVLLRAAADAEALPRFLREKSRVPFRRACIWDDLQAFYINAGKGAAQAQFPVSAPAAMMAPEAAVPATPVAAPAPMRTEVDRPAETTPQAAPEVLTPPHAVPRSGARQMQLETGSTYITKSMNDSWQIVSGRAVVFVVPLDEQGGMNGNLEFLRDVSREGIGLIPGMRFEEEDRRYGFVVRPVDGDVVLESTRCTQAARKNFLVGTGAEKFLEFEGFERACIQYYREKNDVQSHVAYIMTLRQKGRLPEARWKAIMIGLGLDPSSYIPDDDSELYQALRFLCDKGRIALPPEDELRRRSARMELNISDMAQAGHFIARDVVLDANWWTCDCGMLLCRREKNHVACIPMSRGRYRYYEPATGKTGDLTPEIAKELSPKAVSIRRALPAASLKRKDIIHFVMGSFHAGDLVWMVLLGIIGTAVSLLLPMLEQQIYDDCIPMGETGMLVQLAVVTGSFMLGSVFFSLVQKLFEFRISTRAGYELQDAMYYRVFEMKESFLRTFESGDLAQRVQCVGQLTNTVVTKILSTGLSTVFSLLYLFQMIKYAKPLTLPALLMVAVYGVVVYLISSLAVRHEKVRAESSNQATAKLHQYLDGVQKIRMAGAEDKVVLDHTRAAAVTQRAFILSNRISALTQVLRDAGPTIFSMVLFYLIMRNSRDLSAGQFMAFNSAFGSLCAAIMALVGELIAYRYLRPSLELVSPLMKAVPEMAEDASLSCPEELTGSVSLEHVTFAYTEGAEPVLRDLSLNIRPGEYVAIVGPSGCGKSTVFKLLLGFETPDAGCVKYDGADLASIDKHALRRRLGTVLQNGSLIAGSIYDNITITMENPSRRAAQSAVERVGLADDIKGMPMGLETVISESAGTISGGQKQRILIARAIAGTPKILLFDEATSALDNITQAKVCQSLDEMDVTRIVIAHRLSTIRNCDRILVLSGGRVVQEGTFRELYGQPGLFHDMAVRQIAEGELET